MFDSAKRYASNEIYKSEINTGYNEADIYVPSINETETAIGGNITREWVDDAYSDFIEQYNQLKTDNDKESSKVAGSWIRPIVICFMSIIIGLFSGETIKWIAAIVFGISGCSFALKMCFIQTRLNNVNEKYKAKQKALCEELYQVNLVYFVKRFNESPTQIQHDILKIDRERNWWIKYDLSQVMERELERKYKYEANDLKKSDLQVENLQLQNEGIAIDNAQKKFWRCVSCGNLNRADDMRCPSCGGIRQMEG